MALRPYWSGTLRISLVTLNVQMFTAVDSKAQIAFHQVYKPTGERVHEKLFAGDKEVERDELVKGYEVEKGEYVLFDPEEIKELKIPSNKTMELNSFVPAAEIDPVYFDTSYYLAPSEKGDAATFAVIRDAMIEAKVVGLGQIVLSGRERLCAVQPYGPGFLLETLHYADEIKPSAAVFGDAKASKAAPDEKDLAAELIKRKTGTFKPEDYHDRYADALKELVAARIEKREAVLPVEAPTAKVINLMDALRQSLKPSMASDDQARAAKTDDKPAKPRAKKKAAR